MGCVNSVPTKNDEDTEFASILNTSSLPSGDRKLSIILREKRTGANRRHDIFAESVAFDTPIKHVTVPKSQESRNLILEALTNNFLFHTIDSKDIELIVDMMVEKNASTIGEVIIKEGDSGDFFYVVESGTFQITVKGENVGMVQRGATFGELALVYNCPRAATITTNEPGRLWSLDRVTFRQMVAHHQADQLVETKNCLRQVPLLQTLTETQLGQIAEVAQLVHFSKGERIIQKGERGNVLYIIKSGSVICSETTEPTASASASTSASASASASATEAGSSENVRLSKGEYFGERALMTNEPRAANVTAESDDVVLLALDRQAFDDLLGSLKEVIDRNMSMRVLQSIPLLKNLSKYEKNQLFLALESVHFQKGEYIIREGEKGNSFYIIKNGTAIVKKTTTTTTIIKNNTIDKIEKENKKQIATLSNGDFFGEMSLLFDEPRQADVIAINGALECFKLDQTKFIELLGPLQTILNREADERKQKIFQSQSQNQKQLFENIQMEDLEILRTLGSGTFGRVKLVRHKKSGMPFAMKILSKKQILLNKQQQNVMNEKNLLSKCDHPFLLKLYQTFKDSKKLYLLVEFVQGGELFQYLHCQPNSIGKITEQHAKFYFSHVLLALEYLHEKNIIYRDLKPENLLIDPQGYLKVVDFGFAKIVEDRTYTLCGTPEYLAPELVLGKGHNRGVDYWALGVLLYEMVVGSSPFVATNPSDQMQICRNIVKEPVRYPSTMSASCRDLISKLLERDVPKRLGLTHGGTNAIRSHPWLENLNWEKIINKKELAPYRPKLTDPFDTSKFDMIQQDDEEEEEQNNEPTRKNASRREMEQWDKDF
jgi:serine/threonine protein kinase/CRP-like cAMP-binding protein